MERVVLVDDDGNEIGTMEKLQAHREPGHLHLAFSVFLKNPAGSFLMQRRSLGKYHYPGVWANSCCSHPRPGEPVTKAATRRVFEELGIRCEPVEVGTFTYRATDPVSGLVEHELDHVFTATAADDPDPDASEVMDWRWVDAHELIRWVDAEEDQSLAPWVSAAIKALPGIID